MQTKNRYNATLTVKFDLTTFGELDGSAMAERLKTFITAQFMPEIREIGDPGILFDVSLAIEEMAPDDQSMDESTFFLAMADYLERRSQGGQRCTCPTCTKVGSILNMLSSVEQRQFIQWLRTREPMTIGSHDPMRLLKLLVAIGMVDTLSTAYSENRPQPGIGPHFDPAARMN